MDGQFDRGAVLSTSDTRTLVAALTGPARRGPCPTQQEFVAVLTDTNEWVTVEIDGCWRVARSYPHSGTGTADGHVLQGLLARL